MTKYRPHEQRGKLAKGDQIATLRRALKLCTDFSVAVDGGANKGEWTLVMADRFKTVHAFEPAADMADRLTKNAGDRQGVKIHRVALWRETTTHLAIIDRRPGNTRSRYVEEWGPDKTARGPEIGGVAIDDLELPACGLLKLDLEGAEILALHGATETLKRCRPVVIVECDDLARRRGHGDEDDAGAFLASLGARERFRAGKDRVYSW